MANIEGVYNKIDEQVALIRRYNGLLQTNLFAVNFQLPQKHYQGVEGSEIISFLCCGVKAPFYKLKEEKAFYNHREKKFAAGIDLDSTTFTFYVNGSGSFQNPIDIFRQWTQMIMMPDYDSEYKGFLEYKENYATDIEILILDNNALCITKFKLINAYPTNIDSLDMSFQMTDVMRLNVTFNFDDIEMSEELIREGEFNIEQTLARHGSQKPGFMGLAAKGINKAMDAANNRFSSNSDPMPGDYNVRTLQTPKGPQPRWDRKRLMSIANSFKRMAEQEKQRVEQKKGEIASKKATFNALFRTVKKEARKIQNDTKVLKREVKKVKSTGPKKLLTK